MSSKTASIFVPSFAEISGSVPEDSLEPDSRICIRVTDKTGATKFYEAYTLSKDGTDGGFTAFIPISEFGTIEEAQGCDIDIFRVSGIDEAAPVPQTDEGAEEGGQAEGENPDSSGKTEVSRVAFPSCADPDHGYYEITWSDGTKTYEEY